MLVLLFERDRERSVGVQLFAKIDGKIWSRVCLVICVLFGFFSGWLVAPSFFGTFFGSLIGVTGGGLCSLVWQNQALSIPRRIYVCIFVTFLVLIATLIETALILNAPLLVRFLIFLAVLGYLMIRGPRSAGKVSSAEKSQGKE